MKILFLTHKIPYPPNKGEKIPVFYRLLHLSKRHRLYLAFPAFSKEETRHVDALKKHCAGVETAHINVLWAKFKSMVSVFSKDPVTLPYFYSRRLQKKINNLLKNEKFDLIYVFSSSMAQYVLDVKKTIKIMDFVDADSDKWLQYSRHSRFPFSLIYRSEWKKMRRYEKLLAKNFEHTISISEEEKKLFSSYIEELDMSVIPNGVNLEYFKPGNNGYKKHRVVFIGAMDYFANIDSVLYFYRSILRIIKKRVRDIEFYVVGSNPSKEIRRLEKDRRVKVTGFVDDVRPYLRTSCVCVAPIRIARGIQNKILEAMASGVPVVTTTKGNEGINAGTGEHLLVADTPGEFADNVIKLMLDEQLRDRIASGGRLFVEQQHDWEKNLNKLEKILIKKANKQ